MWVPIIALFGIAILVLILLLFRNRPEIIVFISIILNFAPAPLMITASYVLMFMVSFYLFLIRIIRNQKVISFDIVNVSWLAIMLLGLFTVTKWNYKYLGLQWYTTLAIIPFILYVLIQDDYISKDGIKWILVKGIPFLFGFIVIEAIFAFMSVLLQNDLNVSAFTFSLFRKLSIPGNGSNRLADILIFIAVFGYTSMELWKGRWLKNIVMQFIIISAFFIALTMMSRGSLVGLFMAVITFIFGKMLTDRKIKILPIIVSLLTVLFVLRPFINQIIFRVQNIKVDFSTLYRLSMWWDCLVQIKDGIFVGTGPGQFPYRIFNEIHDDPHNMLLRYGVEFGGISIILLMAILAYPFYLFLKKYRSDPKTTMAIFLLFAPALLGTLMHSQIDYIINSKSYGPFYWLMWAICIKMLSSKVHLNKANSF
jgi:O-antigen ligase